MAICHPPTGYEPKLLDDFHYSDTTETIFLSSPLFIQERKEPADRRQAYHSCEESLLPAQSFSVCHSRTGIKILLERQREQILANFRAEIHKHEFQTDSDRRSIQELNGIIESQRREN